MTYHWSLYFCLFLALWTALVGGVFKAFSEFIMRGLLRATPSSGIEAMQHINRTVLGTEFVAAIILIAAFSPAFALFAVLKFSGAAMIMLVVASLVYLPSVFLMTMLGNVPMNNKLDRLDRSSLAAAEYWPIYGRAWTRLNHVRTVGCIATSALYAAGAIALITTGQV